MLYVVQRLVSLVLNGTLKEWGLKEAVLMINLIGLLAAQLQRHSQEVSVSPCLTCLLWMRQSAVSTAASCVGVD